MSYNKPFKTYEELLEKLIVEYELKVENYDLGIELMKTISYYDLVNGYKDFFMDNDKFKQNITEKTIFAFLMFDKNFQALLFKYSVYAENTFKTKLSHYIAKNFGVSEQEYLDQKKYILNPSRKQKKIITFNALKNVYSSHTIENPTKHYKDNHNHIPPWILFKNTNFNTVIDLFTFLPSGIKKEVADDYPALSTLEENEKKELVKNAITIIRKFRNKIAHNSKVITYTVEKNELNPTALQKIFDSPIYNKLDKAKKIGKNDMFSMVISLYLMIGNKFLTASFLMELNVLLKAHKSISPDYINYLNLPIDFEDRVYKLMNTDYISQ